MNRTSNAYVRVVKATLGLWHATRRLRRPTRPMVGIALCIGGVFGFLPILGFWMLPLGLAVLAIEVPGFRDRIDAWVARQERDFGTHHNDN